MKKAMVLGATGATGSLVIRQLLKQNIEVLAMVRDLTKLPSDISKSENVKVIEVEIANISVKTLASLIGDCDAVISCLGHNLTLKGIYGKPRRLVTGAIQKVFDAVQLSRKLERTKFILMNTTGNSNRDIPEITPLSQRLVIAILRKLLPPHLDNELAADFLRMNVGDTTSQLEWVVVRPDGLIDENDVSAYELHTSPTRNAIFDAGATSRINVADFMARLVSDDMLWSHWKGKMPVIYNDDKNGNMF